MTREVIPHKNHSVHFLYQSNLLVFFFQENVVVEQTRPALVNAFELISMSHGLDLSGLFKEQKVRIPP